MQAVSHRCWTWVLCWGAQRAWPLSVPSPLTPTVYGLFSGNVLYILFAQSGPETGLLKSVSAVRMRLLVIGVSEEVRWIVPASSSLNSVTITPSYHIQGSENIP